VVPIFQTINKGHLSKLDKNNIAIILKTKILNVDIKRGSHFLKPKMRARIINHNDSSTLTIQSNNYFANNINFTFYEQSGKEQKTTWTSNPNYTFDNSNSFVSMVKMKDDLHREDVFIDTSHLRPSKKIDQIKHLYIYFLGFLVYTLVLLWAQTRVRVTE